MRHTRLHRTLSGLALGALLCGGAGLAAAADDKKPAPKPGDEQVVVPEVERREVRVPNIPSNDIEAGVFTGIFSTQNFGASAVAGVRLGYHITEDFFVEGALGSTKVSDESFRAILPGGVFGSDKQTLNYYNVSVGWNFHPGEVFFGRNSARPSAVYVIGGIGSTRFARQRYQTINFGLGMRVFLRDWVAIQADVRDHVFKLDLLGKPERTNNLEFTGGITFFF